MSSSNSAMYVMPSGVKETDLLAWYNLHMPKGRDFQDLTWLEELPASFGLGPDWYWCKGPGQSLDIAFGQNEAKDGGKAFVLIAVQRVSDGACG